MNLFHSVLIHWSAPATDKIAEYFKILEPGVSLHIAHGGKEQEFAQISHSRKDFLPDPALRGGLEFQSYVPWMKAAHASFTGRPRPKDWVFFTECDHFPLQKSYLTDLIERAEATDRDFFGNRCADRSNTNDHHYLRNRDSSDLLQRIATFSCRSESALWGFLQTSWLIRWGRLEAILELPIDGAGYTEITIPTFVFHSGGRPGDFSLLGDCYDWVRYRPDYSIDQVLALRMQGVRFVHPFKEAASAETVARLCSA